MLTHKIISLKRLATAPFLMKMPTPKNAERADALLRKALGLPKKAKNG